MPFFLKSMNRDGESCEIWEGWVREYTEGRGSECSEGGGRRGGVVSVVKVGSEPEATDCSLYIPTPERPRTMVHPIPLPSRLFD